MVAGDHPPYSTTAQCIPNGQKINGIEQHSALHLGDQDKARHKRCLTDAGSHTLLLPLMLLTRAAPTSQAIHTGTHALRTWITEDENAWMESC